MMIWAVDSSNASKINQDFTQRKRLTIVHSQHIEHQPIPWMHLLHLLQKSIQAHGIRMLTVAMPARQTKKVAVKERSACTYHRQLAVTHQQTSSGHENSEKLYLAQLALAVCSSTAPSSWCPQVGIPRVKCACISHL